ncbi:MAG: DeoR/GlpR family DNA-binding transcription regulator [Clostridiaceae bacterium]
MKNSTGIISKRQQLILQKLKENHSVKIDELSKTLSVSPITIRRDLQLFENNGIVERFYGGATLIEGSLGDDPSLSDTSEKLSQQKHAIAKYAASLIEDGDTIFINSSSTALLVLEYVGNKHITVITNNGKALQADSAPNIELVLTGGEVNRRKKCMVGDFATHILSKIAADKCFLGVSGVSAHSGISTSVLQETAVNAMMLKRCTGPKYILADCSKVGKDHNFIIGELGRMSEKMFTLITDSGADPHEIERLKEKGIEIIQVNPKITE